MDNKNEVLIYEDKDGITKVNVTYADEDIWLTQNQLANIYKTTQENISMHISNIYKDEELPKNSTNKKFLLVQNEGSRSVKRNIDHYNLDMIIALGYRVQSEVAVRFRIWATQRLHEYIQKGFTMDDERFKQGGNRYFKKLDNQILMNRRKVLEGTGKVSHEEAIKKAEKEFQIYREREMKELESDFDLLMKSLPSNDNK